ncbi:nucleoid-associated protein [Acinetobacter pollinis]|uniref:Nucleoid-associated protein n=1 Tax=Acinetobacter pollinis TaxID=2605270 RepID=A0ABU6DQL9_9GAMM|nr:nucleoid-associated protein [Acinetobacter pollinis]MEB5475952.1 nucleoid-associated protein [Acinetobacter pollinis]
MEINNIIIHEVRRTKDNNSLIENYKAEENDLSTLEDELKNNLLELFIRSNLNFGEFALDNNPKLIPAFEQTLSKHFNADNECLTFVEMTIELAKIYAAIIRENKLSNVKGGYLVFYIYKIKDKKCLAIAIVNKTKGADVTNDLEFVASHLLDLSMLHLGASINISDWKSELSHRYIKFKTGRASDIRDYFETFIGCQLDKKAAQTETRELRKAIQDFSKNMLNQDQDQDQDIIDKNLRETYSFISEKQKNEETILLSSIAKHIFPDQNEDFLTYASNERKISEFIQIDITTLRSFKKISFKNSKFSLSFERELLGNQFKFENGILTITDVPEKLRQELEEEKSNQTNHQ